MNRFIMSLTIVSSLLSYQASSTAVAEMMPTVVVGSAIFAPSSEIQTSHVDIWMSYEGDMAVDLAGYQFAVNLAGPDDSVRFTDVGIPDDRSYLFAPTSAAPIGNITNSGATIEVGDFLLSGTAPLDSGDAIARLQFEVAPNTIGTYAIEVSTEPAESFLAVNATDFIAFSVQNGSITTIPEPHSCILAAIGLALVTGRLVRRRAALDNGFNFS